MLTDKPLYLYGGIVTFIAIIAFFIFWPSNTKIDLSRSDASEEIDRLNSEFLDAVENYRDTHGSGAFPSGEIPQVIKERLSRLELIAESNPDIVIANAISSQERLALPVAIQKYVEEEKVISGILHIVHVDDDLGNSLDSINC